MSQECKPEDVALKSSFLGPQSENGLWFQSAIDDLLRRWFEWRQHQFTDDGRAISSRDQISPEFKRLRSNIDESLSVLSGRLENEYPKYSPRYVGHMFSEVSLPAMLGHVAALLHNPNIISGESARVGVQIEDEAIAALALMVGFSSTHATGHFTSGGTVANYEAVVRARTRLALWIAAGAASAEMRQTVPDPFVDGMIGWTQFSQICTELKNAHGTDWRSKLDDWNFEQIGFHQYQAKCLNQFGIHVEHPVMLVPAHAHYSWSKAAALFGFGSKTIRSTQLSHEGVIDVAHLKTQFNELKSAKQPIMMVVSVMGTTELGAVDPIDEIAAWTNDLQHSGVFLWQHTDAAYGGFLCSMSKEQAKDMSLRLRAALSTVHHSTSITIDPHKLGYVPYSAGAFLVQDRHDYDLKAVGAPYIQYAGLDKGPFTLEGSRPATGAAATWMNARSLGFGPEGLGRIISRTISAKLALETELKKLHLPIYIADEADSNVLCFVIAKDGESVGDTNARTEKTFLAFSEKAEAQFFASKTTLYWQNYGAYLDRFISKWNGRRDSKGLVLIRMCVMNPFLTSKETEIDYVHELGVVLATLVDKSFGSF